MELDEFESVAREAVESLPEGFRPYLDNCELVIEPRATKALLKKVGLRSKHPLLGLYHGVPHPGRSRDQFVVPPSTIYLFHETLLACASSREDLLVQIQKTVLHEIGHHFGFGEKRLRELGYG